ncbi:MAG TPA: DUF4198 domain-containing protein, partial [Planctomycetaceae bacterium]|nr:DUF4198 domain-containing protein [Planctomycetaceae bacterium]
MKARHAGRLAVLVTVIGGPIAARAHDTWLEASQRLVRPDDVVHVGLFLGNHGN